MLQLMQTCSIDPAVPLELMRGVESDLKHVCVADMDELLRYCYRVAGTVGLAALTWIDVQTVSGRVTPAGTVAPVPVRSAHT